MRSLVEWSCRGPVVEPTVTARLVDEIAVEPTQRTAPPHGEFAGEHGTLRVRAIGSEGRSKGTGGHGADLELVRQACERPPCPWVLRSPERTRSLRDLGLG